MTHFIRTSYGDSEASYGPSAPGDPPDMGLLQGNGAAGGGWAAESTVLINCIKSLGFGYSSLSPISKLILQVIAIMFVDNTDLIHSGKSNLTPGAQVMAEMQQVLRYWDGLL